MNHRKIVGWELHSLTRTIHNQIVYQIVPSHAHNTYEIDFLLIYIIQSTSNQLFETCLSMTIFIDIIIDFYTRILYFFAAYRLFSHPPPPPPSASSLVVAHDHRICLSLLLRIPDAAPQGVSNPSNALSSTRFYRALRDIGVLFGDIGRPWPVINEESTGASATDVPLRPGLFSQSSSNWAISG